jgi:hypothetical protein
MCSRSAQEVAWTVLVALCSKAKYQKLKANPTPRALSQALGNCPAGV